MTNAPLHIVHTESSRGWGGQEIRILTEARGLVDRGHRVTLVVCEDAAIAPAARERGLTTVTLPIGERKFAGLRALMGWIRAHRRDVDLINTHSSTDSWLAGVACRLIPGAPPIVRTRHVSSPVSTNLATRWLYASAVDHVVTTGEALRRRLIEVNGLAPGHVTSVPTGIDLTRFAPAAEGRAAMAAALGLPAGPMLGILATLRNWKGHSFLFDAFARIAGDFPDWRLLIVGDGPQRANLERQADTLGLRDRVVFTGNREDPEHYLAAMDLFALPSWGNEGVPQSIMQAMATGLPVISTPVGAIEEAVVRDVTGLIVPPKDVDALAAALARTMGDEALRQRLGAAGLARAHERFGLDVMLDDMEKIFRAVAKGD